MPDTARSRTGLQAPKGTTDTVDTYDDTIATAFDWIEGNTAIDGQGLLGARPPSTVGTPGKRGRYWFATDTGQLFRDNGTGWNEVTVKPSLVTTLPTTNLYTGLEVYFRDANMKSHGWPAWHLRYDSTISGAYKWEVLSAQPMSTWQDAQATAWTTVGYSDPNDIEIVLPLAGNYLCGFGARIRPNTAGTPGFAALAATGLTPNDNQSIDVQQQSGGTAVRASAARHIEAPAISGSLRMHLKASLAADFDRRWMTAVPRLVG